MKLSRNKQIKPNQIAVNSNVRFMHNTFQSIPNRTVLDEILILWFLELNYENNKVLNSHEVDAKKFFELLLFR